MSKARVGGRRLRGLAASRLRGLSGEDFLHRPVSRTLENVTASADGKVRFVIAHRDPGVPNWLEPMGNERGFMTLRWLEARDAAVPAPVVTRVRLTELAEAL